MPDALRLIIPARATVQEWYPLVELVEKIMTPSGDIIVDASGLERAEPFGTTLLAAALAFREAQGFGGAAFIFPKDAESKGFLREVGFPRAEAMSGSDAGSSQTIRMRQLKAHDPLYVHEMATLVQRLVPGTPETAAELIELCLNELCQNAFEHSASPVGCFVHGRWFLKDSNVRIAVADAGVGVANSLRRNPRFQNLSEIELLKAAVLTEGATGRTAGRYGGFGLKHLRDLATQRSGRLTVVSGRFKLEATRDKVRHHQCPRLQGTIVEVDFRPGAQVQGAEGGTF